MKLEAPRIDLSDSCLFFDVDGTLVDLAPTPYQARVAPPLVSQLAALGKLAGGALCLISGRPIAELDQLFVPLRLPCAGVHGMERRSAAGRLYRSADFDVALEAVERELEQQIAGHDGLLVEHKPGALALHYRRVPDAAAYARLVMGNLAAAHAPDFALIDGDMVVELLPAGCNKAVAVDAFMNEAPFAGRRPVYVGDDTTDFDGFAAVRRHDGIDIAVGDRVTASWHFSSPTAVRQWVAQLVAAAAHSA